jgi:hypothetical protein
MNQINIIDQRKIKKKNETEKNMRKRVKREAAEWIEKESGESMAVPHWRGLIPCKE